MKSRGRHSQICSNAAHNLYLLRTNAQANLHEIAEFFAFGRRFCTHSTFVQSSSTWSMEPQCSYNITMTSFMHQNPHTVLKNRSP